MEFAISWLSVIGAGVLCTIAASAWYSPDKQISAVWFAFAGGVCVLLAMALQAHVHVATFVVQPKIELEPPTVPTHFRWQIPGGPVTRQPGETITSSSPKFKLRNASSIFAADVTVEWSAPVIDPAVLTNSSPQFGHLVDNMRDDSYQLKMPQGPDGTHYGPITYMSAIRSPVSIAFLNRGVETYIPGDVFWRGLLILYARLPNQPGNETFDIEFKATVSWNIPIAASLSRFELLPTSATPNS